MDGLALYVFYSLLAIIVICFIVKIMYWYSSKGKGSARFIKSFFKIYSKNRIYSATENWRKYLTASNIINIIWWVVFAIALVLYLKSDVLA